jgi:hypothetical protein
LKVIIEATQEEFDSKRESLVKALSGAKFELVNKFEVNFRTPRRGRFKAQKEMLNYYDLKFKELLKEIKEDINAIIG